MPATIASDCGCRGRTRMSSCHGLSAGKTWSASRTRSASGVSNSSGFAIVGIDGARLEVTTPARASVAHSLDNHDLEAAGPQRGHEVRIGLVVGDDPVHLVETG